MCACVCVSLTACPYYWTDPDVTRGMVGGGLYLCTIGRCRGFVAMTTQPESEISANACTGSMPGSICCCTEITLFIGVSPYITKPQIMSNVYYPAGVADVGPSTSETEGRPMVRLEAKLCQKTEAQEQNQRNKVAYLTVNAASNLARILHFMSTVRSPDKGQGGCKLKMLPV